MIDLDREISQRLPGWIDLLAGLVQIPSPFELEHKMIDSVKRHALLRGLRPIMVPFVPAHLAKLKGAQPPFSNVPNRANICLRIPGRGGGRSLAFNAHLDVVPEGDPSRWTHHPFSGHIDRDKNIMYGRGIMDNKAGVALALALAELLTLRTEPLAGDVVFHFVLEDETTGNGTLLCLDAGLTTDAAIVLDGTRLERAINQHAGNLMFGAKVDGRAASVSVSHMGSNAAEMLAELMLVLKKTIHDLNPDRTEPWVQFLSPNQFSLQEINSVGASLTLPEKAEAMAYVTFTPPRTLADIKAMIESTARTFATERGWTTSLSFDWNKFSAEPVISPSPPIGRLLDDCARRRGMAPIVMGPSTGTSDLRHYVAYGVPSVLYGPGRGYNPHRPDEHYLLEDFPVMVRLLHDVMVEWCGQ